MYFTNMDEHARVVNVKGGNNWPELFSLNPFPLTPVPDIKILIGTGDDVVPVIADSVIDKMSVVRAKTTPIYERKKGGADDELDYDKPKKGWLEHIYKLCVKFFKLKQYDVLQILLYRYVYVTSVMSSQEFQDVIVSITGNNHSFAINVVYEKDGIVYICFYIEISKTEKYILSIPLRSVLLCKHEKIDATKCYRYNISIPIHDITNEPVGVLSDFGNININGFELNVGEPFVTCSIGGISVQGVSSITHSARNDITAVVSMDTSWIFDSEVPEEAFQFVEDKLIYDAPDFHEGFGHLSRVYQYALYYQGETIFFVEAEAAVGFYHNERMYGTTMSSPDIFIYTGNEVDIFKGNTFVYNVNEDSFDVSTEYYTYGIYSTSIPSFEDLPSYDAIYTLYYPSINSNSADGFAYIHTARKILDFEDIKAAIYSGKSVDLSGINSLQSMINQLDLLKVTGYIDRDGCYTLDMGWKSGVAEGCVDVNRRNVQKMWENDPDEDSEFEEKLDYFHGHRVRYASPAALEVIRGSVLEYIQPAIENIHIYNSDVDNHSEDKIVSGNKVIELLDGYIEATSSILLNNFASQNLVNTAIGIFSLSRNYIILKL